MKKRKSLVVRFVVGFMILGILICAVTTAQGYEQYKSYIQKQYIVENTLAKTLYIVVKL